MLAPPAPPEAATRVGAPATATRPEPQRLAETVQGRVAVVTGGATGLGRSTALEFAQRGVAMSINYVDLRDGDVAAQALLTETALRAHGVPVYCARCDVRHRDEVEKFVTTVRERLGGVHYLINNAGVTHDGALWRLTSEAWQEVLDTNVTGAFNCIQAVAGPMRAQRYGKIVNVASHQAFRPGFGIANYAASKAALLGLTKSAAVDLGPSNINVNAVAPGFVKTELLGKLPREVLGALEHFPRQLAQQLRLHEAGGDGVDVDVGGTEVHGGGLGEADERRLARRIVRDAEARPERLMAGDVDDLAVTLGPHRPGNRLNAVERAGDVGVEHLLPRLGCQAPQRAVVRHAGVVDEIVDTAQPLAHGHDELFHLVAVAHVAAGAVHR